MISTTKKTEVLILEAMKPGQPVIAQKLGLAISTVNKIINDRTRILVIGDSHSGHIAGLTPPKWQTNDKQATVWDWYSNTVKMLNADVLFCMGDMMEGKGWRSGGTELITIAWKEQIDMAGEVIEEAGCKTITMVYGTPYHVGTNDDFEDMLAQNVGATIKSHAFPICNGIQFDLKHKVGGSTIPHGRATPLQKAKLWNKMWHDHNEEQPRADIILRGHVHYHEYTGNSSGLAMTCPALQGWGSKFGQRQCEGIVDTGIVWFDIRPGDTIETLRWQAILPKFDHHKVITYEV